MIQLAVFLLLDALPAGVSMALRPPAPQALVTPAQVWPALSLDLRTRVSGLLTPVALNVIVACPAAAEAGKVVADVHPATGAQNPS